MDVKRYLSIFLPIFVVTNIMWFVGYYMGKNYMKKAIMENEKVMSPFKDEDVVTRILLEEDAYGKKYTITVFSSSGDSTFETKVTVKDLIGIKAYIEEQLKR